MRSDAFELMKSIGDVKLADAAAAIEANIKVQPLESTAYLIYEHKAFRYYCEFAAVSRSRWRHAGAQGDGRLMVLACGNITCAKTALVHVPA